MERLNAVKDEHSRIITVVGNQFQPLMMRSIDHEDYIEPCRLAIQELSSPPSPTPPPSSFIIYHHLLSSSTITEHISLWELIDIATAGSFAPSKCFYIRTVRT